MASWSLGTFDIEYEQLGQAALVRHQGKYWNVWSVPVDGSLKLESEIWGYLHPIADPASLYVTLDDATPNTLSPSVDRDPAVRFELLALNTLMQEAVRSRDGRLRADFFAADAVFMPHADSPKRGIDAIRKHLVEYNSGPVTIDSISIRTHELRAFAGYVIEYPKFHVAWRTPESSGVSSGQGARIWRRDPDCRLRIYREIGTHDFVN
jgi:ketosteroid isomerase-like protein